MRCRNLPAVLLTAAAAFAQDTRSEARQDVWVRVRTMTTALVRSDDSRLALTGLARIGATVCRYDRGEAGDVFLAAADRQQRRGASVSWAAWQQVLLSADACVNGLGAELTARARIRPPSARALEASIAEGLDVVQDSAREAAEKLEPAVPFFGDLSTSGQESFTQLLLKIRGDDSDRADALFADTLSYVKLRPSGALAPLFVLGNYLYTAPEVPADQFPLTPADTNGVRIYQLTLERPEASPELTAQYLEAVGTALTVSPDDPRRFLLAYQLYPRAAEVSENLAGRYRAALDAGGGPSPDLLAQFRPLGVLAQSNSLLQAFQAAWRSRRPDAARAVLADYPLGPTKDILIQLTAFAEATELLRAGWVNGALDVVRPVGSEVLRTLVYLGAAAASKDARYASSLLSLAAGEIDKCPPATRSSLWLALASVQTRHDTDASFFAFGQWTKTENNPRTKAAAGGFRATGAGFVLTVNSGDAIARFWLRVPGVESYTPAQALPALAGLDADRTEAAAAGTRNSDSQWELRIQALAARLAAAFH